MTAFSWTCPFCQRPVTVNTETDVSSEETQLGSVNKDGLRIAQARFIICPNPECRKISLDVEMYSAYVNDEHSGQLSKNRLLKSWSLIPESKAIPFPGYIPKAIRDDYNEACLILEKSPKAAATLARRCLQGITRDFWKVKVKSRRLSDEIQKIKDKVDPKTWAAIESVRSVGNIGKHMEQDVNLVISIESKEADLLVGLVEILLRDWYIARYERETHLQEIKQIAAEKEATKKKGS